jgi:hypothetical protein
MVLMVIVSLLTKAPDPQSVEEIIWSRQRARLPKAERERNHGIRSLFLWWAIFIGIMAALYVNIIWFQYGGPGAALTGRS